MTEPIGQVSGLHRYPVKSMAADSLDAAYVGWNGVQGDRRFAFVRPDAQNSGFPWLTLRENAAMAFYRPRIEDGDDPERSAVRVRTPSGVERDVTDPALGAELGEGAKVIRIERGTFDSLPLSLITMATVRYLCEQMDVAVEPMRFRPNLVIETNDTVPFAEDDWVGHELQIGEAVFRVDRRDPRCVIVNLDPHTGERNARLVKWLGAHRDRCAGVYGSIAAQGDVRCGDEVFLR